MKTREFANLTCVLRPDGTTLWLPPEIMESLRLERGQRLTPAEFGSKAIKKLLAERTKPPAKKSAK